MQFAFAFYHFAMEEAQPPTSFTSKCGESEPKYPHMVLSQGAVDACRLPLCKPQLAQLFTVESARDRVYVRLTSDFAEVAKQLGSVQEGHR